MPPRKSGQDAQKKEGDTMAESKTFFSAAIIYFPRREGQTLGDYREELRQLTQKDREDLAPLLSEVLGCTVTP
jgi:hypothetical protein